MQLSPGTLVADRYVVEGPLGQGGMAVVYRVRHRTLGTQHALKLVATTSASARERLIREGRLQGQLQHPNVVGVTDQVEVLGVGGIVLELVDGPPLSHLLGAPLSVAQIDALGAGILAGVAAAHRIGLVHRDLKPGNVLVAVEEGRAVPKVTDFGLAVDPSSEDRATRSGVALGTPEYMSPEQVRSARDVDARADVWALGVLLYELATGKLPFEDEDRFALFQKITTGHYTSPDVLRPDLPARMVATIESALRIDRDRRPPNADALWNTWSAEVRDARIDDLAARVMQLAPSLSSGPSESAPALTLPPAATWSPPPSMFPEPPAPASEELPPPPRPAVVPPSRSWSTPVLLLASQVVALGIAGAAALLVWTLTRGPDTVTPPTPLPTPTVEGVADDVEGLEAQLDLTPTGPVGAIEAFEDARFAEVEEKGHFFVASSEEALLLMSTAALARHESYSANEAMTLAARRAAAGEFAEVVVAHLAGAGSLRGWVAAHPDDAKAMVWWLRSACPGPECADIDLEPIRTSLAGRALPLYLTQLQARETGDFEASEVALDAWSDLAPTEPTALHERARLRIAQGRPADALALLEPVTQIEADRSGPSVHALRGLAAHSIGDDVTWRSAKQAGLRGRASTIHGFATTVAPVMLAEGDTAGARGLVDEALGRMYRNDDISSELDSQIVFTGLLAAGQARDRAAADHYVQLIRGSSDREKGQGWVDLALEHHLSLAEVVRLVARGDHAAANVQLERVRAAIPHHPDLPRVTQLVEQGV